MVMERKNKIQISQEAFDALVQENINDFDMPSEEAIEDAIRTFTLQGADLTDSVSLSQPTSHVSNEYIALSEALDAFYLLCSSEGRQNVFIAIKNGGIELLISICASAYPRDERTLTCALKVLELLLPDLQSTENFRQNNGSKVLKEILDKNCHKSSVVEKGCAVVSAAVTGNEIVKEEFMELKIDELLLNLLRIKDNRSLQSIYNAIRLLVTADDNRVVASQAYAYARRFAEIGMVDVLLDVARDTSLSGYALSVCCVTLRSIAVNDEICKSVAEKGGLDVVLQCIDYCIKQKNKTFAKTSCSLLTQLAGSDTNKETISLKGGIENLVTLATGYSEEPSVLQEVMGAIRALALRSPANASKAVEAGVLDVIIEAMQSYPSASSMQKQACLMIRNLVARNPENRPILLDKGFEKLIRMAKKNHQNCRDAATAALRDLGLSDYNA